MAVEKVYLDSNATAYTDDEIVGKVNAATANITRAGSIEGTAASALDSDDIGEGSSNFYAGTSGADFIKASDDLDDITEGATNKYYPSATQVRTDISVEENATADQTGAEVRDLVVALSDDTREIVISRPTTGQKKIYAIQTHTDGKQEVEQNDTAES